MKPGQRLGGAHWEQLLAVMDQTWCPVVGCTLFPSSWKGPWLKDTSCWAVDEVKGSLSF